MVYIRVFKPEPPSFLSLSLFSFYFFLFFLSPHLTLSLSRITPFLPFFSTTKARSINSEVSPGRPSQQPHWMSPGSALSRVQFTLVVHASHPNRAHPRNPYASRMPRTSVAHPAHQPCHPARQSPSMPSRSHAPITLSQPARTRPTSG